MGIEDHISHQIGTVMTTGLGQDHQNTAHTGKDIDMRLQIEGIGMIAIQAGQIVAIIVTIIGNASSVMVFFIIS